MPGNVGVLLWPGPCELAVCKKRLSRLVRIRIRPNVRMQFSSSAVKARSDGHCWNRVQSLTDRRSMELPMYMELPMNMSAAAYPGRLLVHIMQMHALNRVSLIPIG